MFGLLFVLTSNAFGFTSDEMDKLIFLPRYLSDFINARQVRNLTVTGQKEVAPISGQYFRKPVFSLVQTLQPTFLQIGAFHFTNFDGLLLHGEARGFAKFADVFVYDCRFSNGYSDAIHIKGPPEGNHDVDL